MTTLNGQHKYTAWNTNMADKKTGIKAVDEKTLKVKSEPIKGLKAVDEKTMKVKSEPIKGLKAVDEKTMKIKPDIKAIDEQTLKIKGTQAGHHVTDNNNHTKPVSAADKQAQAKRPAVGNDKSAAKKANGPSWNNGYTN